MTTGQKRKIVAKIQRLEKDILDLEDVRLRLAAAEFASATLSSGGGSQSYTRSDIAKIDGTLRALRGQLTQCRRLLSGGAALGRAVHTFYV